MKLKIENSTKAVGLPQIGDCWRHVNGGGTFLRIADTVGAREYPHLRVDRHFFSVSLNDGAIVATGFTNDSTYEIAIAATIKF